MESRSYTTALIRQAAQAAVELAADLLAERPHSQSGPDALMEMRHEVADQIAEAMQNVEIDFKEPDASKSPTSDPGTSTRSLARAHWARPTGWEALDYWREWVQQLVETGTTLPKGANPYELRSFLRAVAAKCSSGTPAAHTGAPQDVGTEATLMPSVRATTDSETELEPVESPTKAEIADACMSYRHDFGLLDDEMRARVRDQAILWFEAWSKVDGFVILRSRTSK